jgi:transcriptional regulator of met regulon
MVDTQAITVRLPVAVYEDLRREAYETRRPMNELVTESLRGRNVSAGQYGDICDIIERAYQGLPLDGEGDAYKHTSDVARAAAIRIIDTLGLEIAQ